MRFWLYLVLLSALALAGGPAWGCAVPVFRYALERWPTEAYALIVFHRGPLSEADQKVLDGLRKFCASPGNLTNIGLRTVDVSGPLNEELKKLWEAQSNPALPWAVLLYPNAMPDSPAAWTGRLEAPALDTLLDSPARRELAKRLLAGDSVVWLLVDGGDAARDAAANELLTKELPALEKELKLPSADEIAGDPEIRGRALSKLPLQLKFSVLRLRRDAAAEKPFVTLLLRSDSDCPATGAPALFGVFGRARALGPLYGKYLAPRYIQQLAEDLTGPCTCTIKEQNPGFDLLVAADWDALIEDRQVKDPEVPNLAVLAPQLTPAPALTQAGTPSAPPVAASSTVWTWAMLLAGAGLLVLVVLATLTLVFGSRRRHD